jgi:hypothetical protein
VFLCALLQSVRIADVRKDFTTDGPERQSRNQKDFEQEETEETESGKKSSQKCTIPSFSGTDDTDKKSAARIHFPSVPFFKKRNLTRNPKIVSY